MFKFVNLVGKVSSKCFSDWARLYRNRRWERNDDGDILVASVKLRGIYETWAPDGLGVVETPNLLTTEGCNYLLSAGIANGTRYTEFYVAPFSGNVTIADTWTAATFSSSGTELTTQYSEATRPAYTESVPSNKSTNNTSNPAVITAAVDNVTVWGVGILSSSTKGGTTGVLLSVAKYSAARTLPSTSDTLGIKYTLTLANA